MFSSISAVLLGTMSGAGVQAATPLVDSMRFPPVAAGHQRMAITLPPTENEDDIRVELRVGKPLEVGCNTHWFSGDLQKLTARDTGVNYYQLDNPAGPATTLRGCVENTSRRMFVIVRGAGYFLPHNSHAPIVVDVPTGFKVRYRLWRASAVEFPAYEMDANSLASELVNPFSSVVRTVGE